MRDALIYLAILIPSWLVIALRIQSELRKERND